MLQVLLCASLCGMADLCSECECVKYRAHAVANCNIVRMYLLCLRISSTSFKDKGLPVEDDSPVFERKFGAVPKGF